MKACLGLLVQCWGGCRTIVHIPYRIVNPSRSTFCAHVYQIEFDSECEQASAVLQASRRVRSVVAPTSVVYGPHSDQSRPRNRDNILTLRKDPYYYTLADGCVVRVFKFRKSVDLTMFGKFLWE